MKKRNKCGELVGEIRSILWVPLTATATFASFKENPVKTPVRANLRLVQHDLRWIAAHAAGPGMIWPVVRATTASFKD